MDDDPFDSLLGLEDQYYRDGYDLGLKDGSRAGLIEGRLFGLEKGFDRYATMGKLHGQAIVLATRVLNDKEENGGVRMHYPSKNQGDTSIVTPMDMHSQEVNSKKKQEKARTPLPSLSSHTRLEKHVRTLNALVEPSSLSTANSEDSISQFDDRLKRAEGKSKIIEKMIGEPKHDVFKAQVVSLASSATLGREAERASSSIEDAMGLHARHGVEH